MKEKCPRLLEQKKPPVEGAPPNFSIYNACKKEKVLGGDGYYNCEDCAYLLPTTDRR